MTISQATAVNLLLRSIASQQGVAWNVAPNEIGDAGALLADAAHKVLIAGFDGAQFRAALARPSVALLSFVHPRHGGLTSSELKVAAFLQQHRGEWFRPADIRPRDYAGGPSAIGRILGSLIKMGLVGVRQADRGNGTTSKEYSARKGGAR